MHPAFVGRKYLRVPKRHWESRAVLAAIVVLSMATIGADVARFRAPENQPLPTPSLRVVAGETTLGTTAIAAPPTSFGFAPASVTGGHYVMHLAKGAPAFTLSQAQGLFAYYLDAMSRGGWTLQAKGDPAGAGDWTLRWQHASTATLISFYTAPHDKFEVDVCPPEPYC